MEEIIPIEHYEYQQPNKLDIRIIGHYILIGLKYIPHVIIGALGFYLIFQLLLFIGKFHCFQWDWVDFVSKNTFKCFAHADNIWLGFVKPILFILLSISFFFQTTLVFDKNSDNLVNFVCGGITFGILYSLLNDGIYTWVEQHILLVIIGFIILKPILIGVCGIIGGGGGTSNYSYEESAFNDNGRSKQRSEQNRLETEQKLQEDKRKADTISYALQKTNNQVQITLENGHTFSVWGTLVNSTSSTVTVLYAGWYKVYRANGTVERSWHQQ